MLREIRPEPDHGRAAIRDTVAPVYQSRGRKAIEGYSWIWRKSWMAEEPVGSPSGHDRQHQIMKVQEDG